MIGSNWFWALAGSAVYVLGIVMDDLITVVIGAAVAGLYFGQVAAGLRDR